MQSIKKGNTGENAGIEELGGHTRAARERPGTSRQSSSRSFGSPDRGLVLRP